MLNLSPAEQTMASGAQGPAARRALDIVRALAQAAGAARLVQVASVQVAGVSYKNIGEAGLEFLEQWAAEGGKAVVPAWMNPCGADLEAWRELGYSAEFIDKQKRVVAALERLGVQASLTCAPYHVAPPPALGSHLAWSESSAVSVANSVFGARTNREGGPSALASALCGRTAFSGYHLDENRRATLRVRVRCDVAGPEDWGALGFWAGARAGDGSPFFEGLSVPHGWQGLAGLKQLAAAMAASGAVALFHVENATPEADGAGRPAEGAPVLTVDSLDAARRGLGRPGERVDLVAVGCPHLSLEEMRRVALAMAGRPVKTRMWVCVARGVAAEAERLGLRKSIEALGAKVVCDTCVVVAPMADLGVRHIATNSAKAAVYAAMHGSGGVWFGSLEQCVEAAVSGEWPAAPAGPARLCGQAIVDGQAEAEMLVSRQPVSFYGGVDPATGEVRDRGHDLSGQSVAGKVLAFPGGKGSTVGSYVLYALKRAGKAPAALLVEKADAIVAAGAVIAGIPMVAGLSLDGLASGRRARVRGGEVEIG